MDDRSAVSRKLGLWAMSVVLFGISLFFCVGGYYLGEFRMFRKPLVVLPAELLTPGHCDQYIVLTAAGAQEAGYRYRQHGNPGSKEKFARLLLVPIGDMFLVVQVPQDHTGTTFSGVLSTMPRDVWSEMVKVSDQRSWEELQARLRESAPKFVGGRFKVAELPPPTTNFKYRVLPYFLDAEQGPARGVLFLLLGLGCFVSGIVTVVKAIRPIRHRQNSEAITELAPNRRFGGGHAGAAAEDVTAEISKPDELELCYLCGKQLTGEERRARVCQACRC